MSIQQPSVLYTCPVDRFQPAQGGTFLLLVEHGQAVAGDTFMQTDAGAAEMKRVWTHSQHRRRGLARLVMAELEASAAARRPAGPPRILCVAPF